MKKTHALGAVAVLTALALTGCGAGEPAAEAPTAKQVREPAVNELMKDETAKGLSATSYYYFDAVNYALQTGDTGLMLSVAADCAECAEEASAIEAVYADGGRIEGGQPKAQNVMALGEPDADGALSAVVPYMEDAKTVYAADGSVIEETTWDADGTVYTVQGRYADGAWSLVSLAETPDAELPEE
ncbi:DUF6318 family protein [Zafaria sp. Z1313]|uniref:DUF6318 family protein n=1 Tax=unclassified Zafaria TaxID=2828765 RepID=UPI002E76FCEC|nr:DUF6318 family protein [Zafaria sp. J156]MEE1619847.1 DUF6318 family protein [Zafaria sp. J156]